MDENEEVLDKENIIKNKNKDLNNKNNQEIKNIEFEVILVGESNVGKTSIFKKFIDDTFSDTLACTINIDYKVKSIKINENLIVDLKIYDTAGQEKFKALTKKYYQNANGVILVFDLTDENSFTKLNKWVNDINDNAGNVEVILVGNKSDLENRKVSETKAQIFAKEKKMKYIETSAKEGKNILLLFEELIIGMNKRKNDESSSIPEMGSVNYSYLVKRTELNKKMKCEKESKCC